MGFHCNCSICFCFWNESDVMRVMSMSFHFFFSPSTSQSSESSESRLGKQVESSQSSVIMTERLQDFQAPRDQSHARDL